MSLFSSFILNGHLYFALFWPRLDNTKVFIFPSRNKFHPTNTCGNQNSFRQGGRVFHLLFVSISLHSFLISLCKDVLNYFSSHLGGLKRLHGKIWPWKSWIPAIQKGDPVLPGWNFSYVITGYNLWRVYNTAGMPAKRDRISTQPTEIITIDIVIFRYLIELFPHFLGYYGNSWGRGLIFKSYICWLLQPATLLKVTLLHGCFARFLNCTNGTKSRNASHILDLSAKIVNG